jgi:hypothetical protein
MDELRSKIESACDKAYKVCYGSQNDKRRFTTLMDYLKLEGVRGVIIGLGYCTIKDRRKAFTVKDLNNRFRVNVCSSRGYPYLTPFVDIYKPKPAGRV